MRQARATISTPYPTVDSVVRMFRIPRTRVRKIVAMVDELMTGNGRHSARSAKFVVKKSVTRARRKRSHK